MRRIAIAFLSASLLFPSVAFAATFHTGAAVSIPAPVSDDLYVIAGGLASIKRDVGGDLFVFAERVDIDARVMQGVNVAGATVKVMGIVGNDVRAAGGDVEIRGTIRGDLLVAGGSVVVGNDGAVLGDVIVTGGQVVLRGPVGRNLIVRGGTVSMEGIFHGNVDVQGGEVIVAGPVEGNAKISAKDIEITPNASFKGSVDYWSDREVDFGAALSQGQRATFHQEVLQTSGEKKGAFAAILGAFTLFSLLTGAAILLLLQLATKTFFHDAAKLLRRRPWWSLLWGFLFFMASPIAMILLAITVVGIPFALALLASYLLTLLFAAPVTALVVTHWMELKFKKKWNFWTTFGIAFASFAVLKLLIFIPFLGWAIKVAIVFFAIGAVLVIKVKLWKKIR